MLWCELFGRVCSYGIRWRDREGRRIQSSSALLVSLRRSDPAAASIQSFFPGDGLCCLLGHLLLWGDGRSVGAALERRLQDSPWFIDRVQASTVRLRRVAGVFRFEQSSNIDGGRMRVWGGPAACGQPTPKLPCGFPLLLSVPPLLLVLCSWKRRSSNCSLSFVLEPCDPVSAAFRTRIDSQEDRGSGMDRIVEAPRIDRFLVGFEFKIWDRGFRQSFEAAGSSIVVNDRQPYGGGGDFVYSCVATRSVSLGICAATTTFSEVVAFDRQYI